MCKKQLIKCLALVKRPLKYLSTKRKIKNNKIDCIYFGTPCYGNLGDQQIGKSAIELLQSLNLSCIEISNFNYQLLQDLDYSKIGTLCLQGGGNLGDIYLDDQLFRDNIIRKYQDKKIILFPQTIYYENKSELGQMSITRRIYSSHPNLILVAREQESYKKMKRLFPNNRIILTPDTVLSSDYTKKYKQNRKNSVLFLLRNDLEKSCDDSVVLNWKNQLSKKYQIKEADTIVGYDVYDIMQNKELNKLFNKIASSKVVITDRLHGMIFCAITNTPCIVLSNYNHKIESTYKTWLKHLDYILYVERPNELNIVEVAEKLTHTKPNWEPLTSYFKPLIDELKTNM